MGRCFLPLRRQSFFSFSLHFVGLLLLVSASQSGPYIRENFNVLFEGQNAVFVCDPSGPVDDSITYQWTLNDTHIIATGRSFSINNVKKSDSGLYKCIVRGKIMGKETMAEHATFAYIKKGEFALNSSRI